MVQSCQLALEHGFGAAPSNFIYKRCGLEHGFGADYILKFKGLQCVSFGSSACQPGLEHGFGAKGAHMCRARPRPKKNATRVATLRAPEKNMISCSVLNQL